MKRKGRDRQIALLSLSQVHINFFQRTIVNIFLPINFNICFGYSKNRLIETFCEYPQHMFWLRIRKLFLLRTLNLSHVYVW